MLRSRRYATQRATATAAVVAGLVFGGCETESGAQKAEGVVGEVVDMNVMGQPASGERFLVRFEGTNARLVKLDMPYDSVLSVDSKKGWRDIYLLPHGGGKAVRVQGNVDDLQFSGPAIMLQDLKDGLEELVLPEELRGGRYRIRRIGVLARVRGGAGVRDANLADEFLVDKS